MYIETFESIGKRNEEGKEEKNGKQKTFAAVRKTIGYHRRKINLTVKGTDRNENTNLQTPIYKHLIHA